VEFDNFFGGVMLVSLCRQLAESGAHVVMAVRNTKRANELIQKWKIESEGLGLGMALNVEVSSMNQLSQ
jgi:NAD(P)-dependent dehydrogenase (short-subunit alcohol dehydrogenase family)